MHHPIKMELPSSAYNISQLDSPVTKSPMSQRAQYVDCWKYVVTR